MSAQPTQQPPPVQHEPPQFSGGQSDNPGFQKPNMGGAPPPQFEQPMQSRDELLNHDEQVIPAAKGPGGIQNYGDDTGGIVGGDNNIPDRAEELTPD